MSKWNAGWRRWRVKFFVFFIFPSNSTIYEFTEEAFEISSVQVVSQIFTNVKMCSQSMVLCVSIVHGVRAKWKILNDKKNLSKVHRGNGEEKKDWIKFYKTVTACDFVLPFTKFHSCWIKKKRSLKCQRQL